MISPVFKLRYSFILRPVNAFDTFRIVAAGAGRRIEEIRRSSALESCPRYRATGLVLVETETFVTPKDIHPGRPPARTARNHVGHIIRH
jgi:hypothetical protein